MAIATVADIRVDTSWKTVAFIAVVLLHGALILALSTNHEPPRLLDVGLINFEVVDIPSDLEPAEASPLPAESAVVEPDLPVESMVTSEPKPVPEPIFETKPVVEPLREPKPVVDVPPKPVVHMFTPPRRKPVPPRREIIESKLAPEPLPPRREIVVSQATPKPVVQARQSAPAQAPQKQVVARKAVFVPPSARSTNFSNPKPIYPAVARRRGMEGRVTLLVEVAANGRVLHVSIKKSSGFKILDKAARHAVHKWRFLPATRGGKAVVARLEVPIKFSLKDA